MIILIISTTTILIILHPNSAKASSTSAWRLTCKAGAATLRRAARTAHGQGLEGFLGFRVSGVLGFGIYRV